MASKGPRRPSMYPLRLVHDLRPALPWTIYSLPVAVERHPNLQVIERRFAVRWDEDNDERILAAVLDVFFRSPEALSNLYAVGERKGKLTVWASVFPTSHQNAWVTASNGTAIQDSWALAVINTETKRTGGRQNVSGIGDDIVLRKFSQEHDQLNWLICLFELGPTGPSRPW